MPCAQLVHVGKASLHEEGVAFDGCHPNCKRDGAGSFKHITIPNLFAEQPV